MVDCKIYINSLEDSIILSNGCKYLKCDIEKNRRDFIFKQKDDFDVYRRIVEQTNLLDVFFMQCTIEKIECSDYIGLLKDNSCFTLNGGLVLGKNDDFLEMDELFFEKNLLDGKKMENLIQQSDIIVPLFCNISNNVKKELINIYGLDSKILVELEKLILESVPEYKDTIIEFYKSNKMVKDYCYIMKKEIFYQYASWSNKIINNLIKKVNCTYKNLKEMEFINLSLLILLNVFCIYAEKRFYCISKVELVSSGKRKIYKIDRRNKNEIPILYCIDNAYIPYFAVSLYSLIKNADIFQNYRIIIFEINVSESGKQGILKMIKEYKNFSLEFINVKKYINNINLYVSNHFTIENYLRLLAPMILDEIKKLIYLDADLIVNSDISKLYINTDIEEYLLAACKDADMVGQYNASMYGIKEYIDNELCLINPYNYFQSGVLVINLNNFRKKFKNIDLIKYASKKTWRLVDQDVLNVLCEENVLFLDSVWNVYVDWKENDNSRMDIIKYAPIDMYKEYIESRKNPKIIHYAGFQKPWNDIMMDYADVFWNYAVETLYYEVILSDTCKKGNYIVQNYASDIVNQVDNQGIRIKGIDDTIYVDGIMVKAINKFNKKYPIGSKKRDRLRKIIKKFIR